MSPTTTTIHKSVMGVILINLVGGIVTAVLFYAALAAGIRTHNALGSLYGIGAVATLIVTGLATTIYGWSYIQLTPTGITIVNRTALFIQKTTDCLYSEIQDVNLVEPGILSQIGGYGTLLVQTAGEQPNLKLTFVPNPEHLAAYLLSHSKTKHTSFV